MDKAGASLSRPRSGDLIATDKEDNFAASVSRLSSKRTPSKGSVKPTSNNVNQNKVADTDVTYCRSPADLVDIFSDIVDDLAGLTGLSTLVAPLTDSDPYTECIHGTIVDFFRNDLEEFLNESNNACDFSCEPECEKLGAGEPEIESPRVSTQIFSVSPPVELEIPKKYVPSGFSAKSIPPPPPKKKKPKPNIIAEMPPEEPKKGCCAGCIIL